MSLGNINELIGDHQHGFRKAHSTVTCALELKDTIIASIENREKVIVYSLDLTAAFDMLRVDTFHKELVNDLPADIMGFVVDFLSGRNFFVDIAGNHSSTMATDRGCPQGSVLGPILFSLYVRKALQSLPERVRYLSYADDSYVVIHEKDTKTATEVFESVISSHIKELTSIGMIVNRTKTEIVNFTGSNSQDEPVKTLKVDGCDVETREKMKVLGIIFDKNLSWRVHIEELKKKIAKIQCGIKIIRRKLNFKQTLVIVTSQALSVLYYASVVWLTPHIAKTLLKLVERMHYRCVRLIVRDYRQRVSREVIDKATKRLPPNLWAKYAGCSMMMNLRMQGQPIRMLTDLNTNLYTKGRKEGRLYGFDSSKSKLGKQMTRNWIGHVLGTVDEPWTNRTMNKDQIRLLVKKYFYPQAWED